MGFWSPQDWNFRKIGHFRNFEKQPIQSDFFDFFGLIMHFHAIKSSILTKNGRIFGKSPQFLKNFGACGAKNWSLQPIFPIFRRLRRRKTGHFRPKLAPLLAIAPPNSIPDQRYFGGTPSPINSGFLRHKSPNFRRRRRRKF